MLFILIVVEDRENDRAWFVQKFCDTGFTPWFVSCKFVNSVNSLRLRCLDFLSLKMTQIKGQLVNLSRICMQKFLSIWRRKKSNIWTLSPKADKLEPLSWPQILQRWLVASPTRFENVLYCWFGKSLNRSDVEAFSNSLWSKCGRHNGRKQHFQCKLLSTCPPNAVFVKFL